MKLSTPFCLIFATAGFVDALSHDAMHRRAVHHRDLQVPRDVPVVARRASTSNGRCKPRSRSSSSVPTSTHATAHTTAHTSSPIKEASTTPAETSTSKSASSTPKAAPANNAATPSTDGLINTKGTCNGKGPEASTKITATNGPNGAMSFLNCGVDGGGWTPPDVRIEDLVTVDLSAAINDPGTPYKQCSKYVPTFEKYGQEHGIPAIFLAAFAMQESSCNPNLIGGNGELGLMQITADKCGGLSKPDCMAYDNNIRIAAQYFANSLKDNGYNVLATVGAYNGWDNRMTIASAEAARSHNCFAQNNLDYLMQFFNGWIQNKDAYSMNLGKYFNLAVCH